MSWMRNALPLLDIASPMDDITSSIQGTPAEVVVVILAVVFAVAAIMLIRADKKKRK
ncbi:MAG: hypothetical protein J6B85_00665 [Lachnospiraceae bacterium]|nr:hypothetical protein [Lachnospiraceae bacterium]